MGETADLIATRKAYDEVAADYARLLATQLDEKPYDRAILGAFAARINAGPEAKVADLGCGPGRIAAHLSTLGVPVFGVDLSPAMVAVARRLHPHLSFEEGSIEALPAATGSIAGIVAWYSIIHTPPERLPTVFAEFRRVLLEDSPVLVAFQVGNDQRHISHAYGHDIDLQAYLLDPDAIARMLDVAGFDLEATLVRAPDRYERTPQAFLVARSR